VPASAPPLSIVGVRPGDNLRRPATSSEPLQVRVGAGWWWTALVVPQRPAAGRNPGQDSLLLRLPQVGQAELSALDESGETARVAFQVSE
jgi:penicillin-binding protein 1C